MNIKRIATTLAVPVLGCFIAWMGGYNFDTRGPGVGFSAFMCIFIMAAVWYYPGWTHGPH